MNVLVGFSVSIIGGGVAACLFLKALRAWMRLPKKETPDEDTRAVPPWLTGFIERLFFTLIIYFKFSGVPAAMLIWLTLKMVTNWNSPSRKEQDLNRIRSAFSALLAGLISLGFATVGGVIARGPI